MLVVALRDGDGDRLDSDRDGDRHSDGERHRVRMVTETER